MFDLFGLPSEDARTSIFYATSGSDFQVWNKPRNCQFVYCLLMGGSGGGGGGQSGGAGTNRGGGGGGASSTITRALFPAMLLPNTMYILVGSGGLGGSAGSNGIAGTVSIISAVPSSATSADNILRSGRGLQGDAGSGGAGGLGGSLQSAVSSGYQNLSLFVAGNNVTGSSGGNADVNGGSQSSQNTSFTGGAGGAGIISTPRLGGSVTNSGINPFTISAGGSGRLYMTPLLYGMGGAGGNSVDGGAGQNGGNGGIGCGGGGGGAGTTGGTGGRGGDGLVIIVCI